MAVIAYDKSAAFPPGRVRRAWDQDKRKKTRTNIEDNSRKNIEKGEKTYQ